MTHAIKLSVPLLALLVAACAGTPDRGDPLAPDAGRPPDRGVSIDELAKRHDLDVVSATSRGAVLRDGANTVSVFPDPRGRAFVNGTAVGASGGVVEHAGVLHVPATLATAIGAALRPETPRPVAPAHPPAPGPRPIATARRLGRVVVDAGHGGADSGTAIAAHIALEKTVTLDASLRLERILKRAGVEVLMTRRRDVTVDLDARPAFTNRYRPDAFVSIHADSAESRAAHGFAVYVARQASSNDLALARCIRAEMARTGVTDRGIRRADYRVVKNTSHPAVLVELGFMSNATEARRLATASHRERMAAAIARGILAYLGRP